MLHDHLPRDPSCSTFILISMTAFGDKARLEITFTCPKVADWTEEKIRFMVDLQLRNNSCGHFF